MRIQHTLQEYSMRTGVRTSYSCRMLGDFLDAKGLADASQVLLYLAVAKLG